jgi:hypothetical protein
MRSTRTSCRSAQKAFSARSLSTFCCASLSMNSFVFICIFASLAVPSWIFAFAQVICPDDLASYVNQVSSVSQSHSLVLNPFILIRLHQVVSNNSKLLAGSLLGITVRASHHHVRSCTKFLDRCKFSTVPTGRHCIPSTTCSFFLRHQTRRL